MVRVYDDEALVVVNGRVVQRGGYIEVDVRWNGTISRETGLQPSQVVEPSPAVAEKLHYFEVAEARRRAFGSRWARIG